MEELYFFVIEFNFAVFAVAAKIAVN